MSYAVQAPEHAPAQPPMADAPMFSAAQSFRIRRPGARPLVFQGSELAMVMSFTPELPYWYEVNIYRTDAQHFVLAIRQFFQSETEEDLCQSWEFESLIEVFDAIEQYDAAKDVKLDYPDADASPAELMAAAMKLHAEVGVARAHFDGLVGQLFDELDAAMPNG